MRKLITLVVWLASFQSLSAQLPAIQKGKAHIYLLAGQSNMAGRGTVGAIDTLADPHIWMLTKDERWVPAREPLSFDKPTVVGVGPGFAFAREILRQDASATILLVPSAVGGTRIDLWKPGAYDSTTKTHPYDDAIRRARKAMESGELKGIIWHQGESDCTPALSAVYENKLRELIQRFRTDLNAPSVPFILGEISNFKQVENPSKDVINITIKKVAGSTTYSGFAETTGLKHRGDSVHYDSPSARELGRRYAEVFLPLRH